MARKSSITRLPVKVRKELDKLLMDGKLTIDELHDFIKERLEPIPDAEIPSRSSLGRYSKQLNEVAEYLRESREMAKALAQELGPDSVEGEQGRHLIEILRSFVSNAMKQRIKDPNAKFDANEISKIARSLRDLSHAMHLEQDYAKRIRDDERQKMRQELTDLANTGGFKNMTDEELNAKIIELTTQPGA